MFDSLFCQNYKDFDIYVQQDGPLNSEVSALLDSLKRKGHIILFKSKQNQGLARSLNNLLQEALKRDYKFFFRMDADDICASSRFENQLYYMEKNPDVDVLGGAIEEFNEDSGETQIIRYPQKHSEILHFMGKRCPIAHMTVCFRRSFFSKVDRYPECTVKNEDYLLWIKSALAGAVFANLDCVLVHVRTNNSFFSRRSGYKKAYDDMKWKLYATNKLKLPYWYYIYGIMTFILQISPTSIKKYAYKRLR